MTAQSQLRFLCVGGLLTVSALAVLVCPPAVFAQQSQKSTKASSNAQQEDLVNYLADMLMLANQSEIELSKIAEQQSTNEKVKHFAQTLIADHKQVNDQIAQLSPQAAERFATHQAGRSQGAETRTAGRDTSGHDVLTTLCQINHEAAKNHLESARALLKEYKGQDFDMAFLGLQIGQHTWLLSELKALDGIGTSQFQEIVTATRQKVEQHLKEARMLSKQFEDDRTAS